MKKKVIKAGDLEIFKRVCLYCNDELPVNCHKSRKFCPEKFGQNDHCKYHYKLLRQQNLIAGEKLPTTIKESLQDLTLKLTEEQTQLNEVRNENNKVESKSNNNRENNIETIKHYLGDNEEVEVRLEEFIRAKYDFTVYDSKQPYPDGNYTYCEIGDYAISWFKSNILLITKSINLSCLY